ARLPLDPYRREFPKLLPGLRVISADEAFFLLVKNASRKALNDLTLDDDRPARLGKVLGFRGNPRIPHDLAIDRTKRHHACVRGRSIDLVAIERYIAHRDRPAVSNRGTNLVFPDEIAGARIERLNVVAGVCDKDRIAVDDRRRLIGPALVHCTRPHQPQAFHVRSIDLLQRAVALGLVVAADHEPVASRRIAQHLIGDRNVVLYLSLHGETTRRGDVHGKDTTTDGSSTVT